MAYGKRGHTHTSAPRMGTLSSPLSLAVTQTHTHKKVPSLAAPRSPRRHKTCLLSSYFHSYIFLYKTWIWWQWVLFNKYQISAPRSTRPQNHFCPALCTCKMKYINIQTYMHACMLTYIHACIQTNIQTYIHTYMHTSKQTFCKCIQTYIQAYKHTSIHTHQWRFRRLTATRKNFKNKRTIRLCDAWGRWRFQRLIAIGWVGLGCRLWTSSLSLAPEIRVRIRISIRILIHTGTRIRIHTQQTKPQLCGHLLPHWRRRAHTYV